MLALITGASSGFGRDMAVALAERGVSVILTARSVEPKEEFKPFKQMMQEAKESLTNDNFDDFDSKELMDAEEVFTNEEGEFKPEIMKEAMTVEIEGLNRDVVLDFMDKQNNEELYKYLLITQCNALGKGLSKMFEKSVISNEEIGKLNEEN